MKWSRENVQVLTFRKKNKSQEQIIMIEIQIFSLIWMFQDFYFDTE